MDPNKDIAPAELVANIEDARADSEIVPIFKQADLVIMYSTRVEQPRTCLIERVKSTHRKNRILVQIPNLQPYKEGRDILLVSKQDLNQQRGKHVSMMRMPMRFTLHVLHGLFADRSDL